MRPSSPPPDAVPTLAAKGAANASAHDLGARCLSNASSVSHGSATTDASSLLSLGTAARDSRDSLGSEASSSGFSRQSSGSYSGMPSLSPSTSSNRLSTCSTISTGSTVTGGSNGGGHSSEQRHTKRRGYMRPQGTDFAASARSRESVLSLGSIAHLQHYFARTGLLDLKGQLERKRRGGKARTLDLSQVEGTAGYKGPRVQSMLSLSTGGTGGDGSDSLCPSPMGDGPVFESPVDESMVDDWYPEDFEGADPAVMLPPTVSTYMHREKPLPKPPSLAEIKDELKRCLDSASVALAEAREARASPNAPITPTSSAPSSPARQALPNPDPQNASAKAAVAAWYEIQGMHLLDVMTLAIRAAKVYYTSHDNPDRLDAIKPEREVRSQLLGVMEVLKRMATRNFTGGVRTEEIRGMDAWVNSLYGMLEAEEALIAAERAEQSTWTWLKDDGWPADASPESGDPARAYAREVAFLQTIMASVSMTDDKVDTVLPEWVPMDRSAVMAAAAAAAEAEAAKAAEAAEAEAESATGATAAIAAASVAAAAAAAATTLKSTSSLKPPKSPTTLTTTTTTTTTAAAGHPPPTPTMLSMPTTPAPAPTAFLQHMQNGVCLIQLHNCAVRKSRRRFGAIPTFHADTQKPYRAADNLRYWVKAAELRWEVLLKIDPLGVVCNSRPDVWPAFEDAIYKWCRKVREEITSEVI